ncbi:MAG: PRC-barrel domain-containing protein [Ilumatobacteraceae bacterium]
MSDDLHVTPRPGDPISYLGLPVQDEHGEPVGSVSDVLYDEGTQQPQWLVINPGKLRAEHFVPTEGSYTTEEGNLVIAYSKQMVKEAPKATGDHVISHDVDNELRQYYASV